MSKIFNNDSCASYPARDYSRKYIVPHYACTALCSVLERMEVCLATHSLCPSLTVPNLLPNVAECKKIEIRTNSC